MFTANMKTGQRINLIENPDVSRESDFVCPSCGGSLVLKRGKKLRPHFAHRSRRDCQFAWENESEDHLAAKAGLYRWGGMHHAMRVEQVYPSIEQIADLVLEDHLVLEVQCSPLSIERLKERTRAYRSLGLSQVWLLGPKLWIKDHLTNLQRGFLQFSWHLGFHSWEVDPKEEVLRLRYLIHEDLTGKVQALSKTFAFGQGDLLEVLRSPYRTMPVQSFQGKILQDPVAYVRKQLYFQHPKWMALQEKDYLSGKNLLTARPEDFYPQIRPPQKPSSFLQIPQNLAAYYQGFEAYYKNLSDTKSQVLYSPAFYLPRGC